MPSIITKINDVRTLMQQKHYDYYFVSSTDAHNNEYLPTNWQRRMWISGFDGSAGEALIGMNDAYLWTDGRYFLQAEAQLDPSIFKLQKQQGLSLEFEVWLSEHAKGKTLAVDPTTVSIKRGQALDKIMHEIGGKCIFDTNNIVDIVRKELNDMPQPPSSQAFLHPEQFSGKATKTKLDEVRDKMAKQGVAFVVISMLDEIAWLLNIRGNDIAFNPLIISYVIIGQDMCSFFVDQTKLSTEIKNNLTEQGVTIIDYNCFYSQLSDYEGRIWLDPNSANYSILQHLNKNCEPYFVQSSISLLKACKNIVEIDGAKYAHKKDAIAVISFIYWLENNWQNGVDELSAQDKLLAFRQQQANFKGASFDTISGFASNGAIIHYRSSKKTTKVINESSLYLLDSGGQYLEGTTDITRVFHLGTPKFEHKHYYTLVLKGHLAIQNAHFPKGTKGEQLDTIARLPLWQEQLNYGHGTGHGVGSFLCVHEGPQRISPVNTNQVLEIGMIISNEPGVYFPGQFGIRIENLCFVKKMRKQAHHEFGEFYCFEDLTLVPYARNLIDIQLLSNEEIKQINSYHLRIEKELMPMISDENLKIWLKAQTKAL
ncbi:aminopeptidase P family protein [Fastidiosibacter lacustris]|uniref:aminopeptidase P family protein n=1 Tax=Fastidiosibacter lacustris TaxID=2056695 RepID=UPI000E357D17|nr:aminopeptidase P family protein [Fastidiosibacter lacustris]